LLLAYQATFLNRTTPHARQRDDGSYRWRFQPCDHTVLSAHLTGRITVAVSSLDAAGWCRWLCLDADGEDGRTQLMQLRARLAERGLPGVLEASRRGGHLWLFLAEPVPAALTRDVLLRLLAVLHREGLPLEHMDVYPDTSRVGALGHAVRLPLGVHRLTRRRYPFLDEQGQPLPLAKLPESLAYLAAAPRIPLDHLTLLQAQLPPLPSEEQPPLLAAGEPRPTPDLDHEQAQGRDGDGAVPQPMSTWSGSTTPSATPSATRSEVMRWVDAHVSPFDLLDELAPACAPQRVGQGWLGWCPFHDDQAPQADGVPGTPSFYLVRNARHGWSWRCLSTNCAQHTRPMRHAFRLFQELLGLDTREAIRAALARWPDDLRAR
jgi:hypothetical protein